VHDARHFPPPSAKVKNEWSYAPYSPYMPAWHGEGQLTFFNIHP